MDYILFNGKMVAAGDFNPAGHWLKPHFSLKEKMWFANGEIPFFPDHIRNIEEILALTGKTWPAEIPPQKELVRLSLRLINKNKAFMAGWLSLELLFSPGRVLSWPPLNAIPRGYSLSSNRERQPSSLLFPNSRVIRLAAIFFMPLTCGKQRSSGEKAMKRQSLFS